jgi:hypothetical protein
MKAGKYLPAMHIEEIFYWERAVNLAISPQIPSYFLTLN